MSQYAHKRPAPAKQTLRTGDDELRRAVRERLTRVGDSITSRIRVTVNAGVVVLDGVVNDSYERKLIAQTVSKVNSIKSLNIRLRTRAEATRSDEADDESRNYVRPIAAAVAVVAAVSIAGWWFWPRAEPVRRAKTPFPAADANVPSNDSLRVTKAEQKNALLPEPGTLPQQPVAVRLTFNGQPAAGAFVSLHPDPADETITNRPYGYVGKNGQIAWAGSKQGDAPPSGSYVVTARWHRPSVVDGESEAGYNVLPEAYEKPGTSPLRLKVDETGMSPATLQIER